MRVRTPRTCPRGDLRPPDRRRVGLRSDRGPILLALMVSTGLIAIDATILATAVPSVVRDLGGFAQFPWLFSVYLLAQAVSVPVYAKLADTFGRKPLMLFGIGLFLARLDPLRLRLEHALAHRLPRRAGARRRRRAADGHHHRGRHLHRRRARHGPGLPRLRLGGVVRRRPHARRRLLPARACGAGSSSSTSRCACSPAASSCATSTRRWSAAATRSTTSARGCSRAA